MSLSGKSSRPSGSDGILNFKSLEGFDSEIEPWPFPARRLSISSDGIGPIVVSARWESTNVVRFYRGCFGARYKARASNNFHQFLLAAEARSSVLRFYAWLSYKRGCSCCRRIRKGVKEAFNTLNSRIFHTYDWQSNSLIFLQQIRSFKVE